VIIGPVTAETAVELGVNIDIQAAEQSIDGLVAAITSLVSGT
jgi:uroporphyrinogen-III synthase